MRVASRRNPTGSNRPAAATSSASTASRRSPGTCRNVSVMIAAWLCDSSPASNARPASGASRRPRPTSPVCFASEGDNRSSDCNRRRTACTACCRRPGGAACTARCSNSPAHRLRNARNRSCGPWIARNHARTSPSLHASTSSCANSSITAPNRPTSPSTPLDGSAVRPSRPPPRQRQRPRQGHPQRARPDHRHHRRPDIGRHRTDRPAVRILRGERPRPLPLTCELPPTAVRTPARTDRPRRLRQPSGATPEPATRTGTPDRGSGHPPADRRRTRSLTCQHSHRTRREHSNPPRTLEPAANTRTRREHSNPPRTLDPAANTRSRREHSIPPRTLDPAANTRSRREHSIPSRTPSRLRLRTPHAGPRTRSSTPVDNPTPTSAPANEHRRWPCVPDPEHLDPLTPPREVEPVVAHGCDTTRRRLFDPATVTGPRRRLLDPTGVTGSRRVGGHPKDRGRDPPPRATPPATDRAATEADSDPSNEDERPTVPPAPPPDEPRPDARRPRAAAGSPRRGARRSEPTGRAPGRSPGSWRRSPAAAAPLPAAG
jgi:hypothetical protein